MRIHKRINDNIINFGTESAINVFYEITKRYNNQSEYKDLIITKSDLWKMTGYKGEYNSKEIDNVINRLTESKRYDVSSFNIGMKSISGSLFVITRYLDTGNIKIEVPNSFRQLLFYKRDLELMSKAKKKEKLSVSELDYYDNKVKDKSKFLVLLNEADLLNLKGKYNKRLYALLKQWDRDGIYIRDWDIFKKILEVPKSYRSVEITNILNKAKKDLLEVGIKITKIEKIKKGRSIDKVKILFKTIKREEKDNESKDLQGVEPNATKKKELKTEIRDLKNNEINRDPNGEGKEALKKLMEDLKNNKLKSKVINKKDQIETNIKILSDIMVKEKFATKETLDFITSGYSRKDLLELLESYLKKHEIVSK